MNTQKAQRICPWSLSHPLLQTYHDHEWGVPVHDDQRHFEYFVLDLFQAGLSWLTILKKREGFRRAMDDFDFQRIAFYDEARVRSLLQDEHIIRNRLKIRATISNAQRFLELISTHGSFDRYIWQFTGGRTIQHAYEREEDLPASTDLSDRISRDLKQRGFKFTGTTIVYAYMQAVGLVNDHITSCPRYRELGGGA